MKRFIANLDTKQFKSSSFDDLEVGDIIFSTTFTFSQKCLMIEEYEKFNMTKYGILIEKNNEDKCLSKMLKYDFDNNIFVMENLFANPGISGGYCFGKYYDE